MTALRWLAGASSAARTLRVGAAAVLLVWGCVDQVHYYFALHSSDLADLKRAASLAPYDTPLEVRLARQALGRGTLRTLSLPGNTRSRLTPLIRLPAMHG